MTPGNYVKDILNGEALLDDIDAYVSFWHENDLSQSLQDFLGFTDDEYDKWMKDGNHVVRNILYCRRNGLDFREFEDHAMHEGRSDVPEFLKKYRATA